MDLETKIKKKLKKIKNNPSPSPEEVEKELKLRKLLRKLKKKGDVGSVPSDPSKIKFQKSAKSKNRIKESNIKLDSQDNQATGNDDQEKSETNYKNSEKERDISGLKRFEKSNSSGNFDGDMRKCKYQRNLKMGRNGGFNRDSRGRSSHHGKFTKNGNSHQRQGKHKGLMDLPEEMEQRLTKLRRDLFRKKVDIEEIKQTLRKERRKAENEYKAILKTACYRCRKPGHKLFECPEVQNDMDGMHDVCYKCGSAEHKLYQCKSGKTVLEYVTCFICKEKGHLSKACPQNTRGVYPKGGSCKICESIDHLAKDCPDLVKNGQAPEKEITLGTLDTMESGDAEILKEYDYGLKRKPKVVNF